MLLRLPRCDVAYHVDVLADTCRLGTERVQQQVDVDENGDVSASRVEVTQGQAARLGRIGCDTAG